MLVGLTCLLHIATTQVAVQAKGADVAEGDEVTLHCE